MRYAVVGNTAVLCTRSIENIPLGEPLSVSVSSVPDGSSFCVQGGGGVMGTYRTVSEKTELDISDFPDGIYYVTVKWVTEKDGAYAEHEAAGNPFKLYTEEDGTRAAVAAPVSGITELELIWTAIADMLDIVLPFIDDIKNGINVV